jgi:hypothetical protein
VIYANPLPGRMNVNVQIFRLIYCHYGNDGSTVYSCKMILKDYKTCHAIKGDGACLGVGWGIYKTVHVIEERLIQPVLCLKPERNY